MDASRLGHLISLIDLTLFALCLLLAAAISITVFLQEKILIKRVLGLIRVKKDLFTVASRGRTEMRRVCPVILERISSEDFLELSRSKASFMPPEFAEDLKRCFSISGKSAGLKKSAALRFLPKWQKIQALVSLGYTENEQSFPILKNALNNRDADISYYAMLALAQLKTNTAARALLNHCGQKPADGRKVASCLETFPSTVVDELIRGTHADSDHVRFWAIRVLAKFKDHSSLERVVALSHDPNPEIRSSSCMCLGELNAPKSSSALMERLMDPVWFVRLQAFRALYKIHDGALLGRMDQLKNDPHWAIREAVAQLTTTWRRA